MVGEFTFLSNELQVVFTISEVASIFSVSEETVRRWIKSGRLRASIDSKKEGYKVTEKDLKEFVETQKPKYRKILPFLGLFLSPMVASTILSGLLGLSHGSLVDFFQNYESYEKMEKND